jgi:protocatechuate 3,4-dioxygenase beta subunit
VIRHCSAALLLLGLAPLLAAQTTTGPASYSISGVVLSATAGTPLDRAEVTLSTAGMRGSTVDTTLTGENGAFRFDHLQAGRYRLQASRRGYLPSGYQEHEGYFTGIVTGPNLVSDGLRFELFPTAVIAGVVADDAGEPVGGAQVHLYRQDQATGETKVVNAGQELTDDTGCWEFARLRAGTYFVAVSAMPWYAIHSEPKTDANGGILPVDQQPHQPLDVAYATTFYESGTDSDSATPIPVSAGDHVEVNVSLHAVPAVHIQVRLPQPEEGHGIPMPQIMQSVFGTEVPKSTNSYSWASNGGPVIAELSGLAPGNYVVRQFGEHGENGRTMNAALTSDQSLDLSSSFASGVDVAGKVAMASGEKLPNRPRVSLIPADGGAAGIEAVQIADDGSFTLHSVAPGRYQLRIGSMGNRLAILQMLASGAEVQGEHLTIGSEPVSLAASLAAGSTTIEGYARRNGKALGGVMVLLVPRDPNADPELFRRDQSNTDGSFELSRVIPGDYFLVAIENGWTLDWARREVMAPYLAGGAKVQVTGQKTLELPTAIEIQTR